MVNLGKQSPTFTRATSAYDPVSNTIIGAGVVRSRPIRIGTSGWTEPAYLVEGSRTNLLAAGTSNCFNIAPWTTTDATVTLNQTAAPNGEVTAAKYVEGSAGTGQIANGSATITAGAFVSSAIHIKPSANNNWVFIRVSSDLGANGYRAWFNIATGVTGSSAVLGTGTFTGLRIENSGGGWYRCVSTGKVDPAATLVTFQVSSASADASVTRVSAAAVFLWEAMVEQAQFSSSLISNRNLLLQTEGMQTSWTLTDTTPTSNSGVHPLTGLTNVTLFTQGVAGTANLAQTGTVIVAGSTITASFYLRRGNNDWQVAQVLSTATDGFRVWFNTTTGLVGTSLAIGTGTYTGSSITAVGAFYRVTLTGKVAAASTAPVLLTCATTADAVTTRTNNATYYATAAQLEYGTAATAYWATSTAVGLRAADALTGTFTFSTVAGTITCVCQPYGFSGDQDGATVWAAFTAPLVNNNIRVERASATAVALKQTDGGGVEQTNPTHGITNGANATISLVYDAVSVRGFVAGVAAGTPDTTLTPPYSAAATFTVGNTDTTQRQFYGWVLPLYWARALTPTEELAFAQSVG